VQCECRSVSSEVHAESRAMSGCITYVFGYMFGFFSNHNQLGHRTLRLSDCPKLKSCLDFIGGADADRTRDLLNGICVGAPVRG
jgi:hypothetical protein